MIEPVRQRHSLKNIITLYTLIIFAFSFLALSFYINQILQEDIKHLLRDQQLSTVSILATEINVEMERRIKALEQMAEYASTAKLHGAKAWQKFLEQRQNSMDLFNAGLIAVAIDGAAIAEYPVTGRIGRGFQDRDFIVGALKDGKSTIGKPEMGQVTRTGIIHIAVPVRDRRGQVTGALIGLTDLGRPNFLDNIAEGHFGKTGVYLLVSLQHRLIIICSNKTRNMETLPNPGVNPTIDRFLTGYEGTLIFHDARGVEVQTSTKNIPVAGWQLAVSIPTAEAFVSIYDIKKRMLSATILMTLFAGFMIWWLLRLKLSPLLATVKTLSDISETNRPMQPLEIFNQDEIGKLIGSFNHLLEVLGKRETALKESEERSRKLALLDGLTGIPNRRFFNEVLENEWHRSLRNGTALALIMVDIDHFKAYNDNYGHGEGDECLRAVAKVLEKSLGRASDTVARYGGEEFAAVIPDADLEDARILAEHCCANVAALKLPHRFSGAADHVTISVGYASMKPTKDHSLPELMRLADKMLYRAKEQGRNRICGNATD